MGTSRTAGRRYLLRWGAAMVAYLVLLPAAIAVPNSFPDAPWRYAVVLLPVVPMAWLAVAALLFLREADELQHRLHLEALGFAFATGSLVTFSYGLLQLAGLPTISWLWVWPVYGLMWIMGVAVSSLRYHRNDRA